MQRLHAVPVAHLCAAALVIGLTVGLVAACGAIGTTSAPVTTPSATTGASPPAPTIVATPAAPTLPPGVTRLHDGVLEPGTYRFEGFEPGLDLEIPGPGWEVGHFHDEIFDLFFEGDFPAIGFARFPTVFTAPSSAAPDGSTRPTLSVDVVLATLQGNPDLVVEDVGPVEIAGLTGRTVDVRATREQTALFGAGSDGFHFDPGYVGRFHLLAVDGGVLEIFVTGPDGRLEEAIEVTQPVLDSVRVVETGS